MGLFSKKKNEEVAIDELTPQIKTKLDELAQKGNQFEEEEQYEEAIQAWKEALKLVSRESHPSEERSELPPEIKGQEYHCTLNPHHRNQPHHTVFRLSVDRSPQ